MKIHTSTSMSLWGARPVAGAPVTRSEGFRAFTLMEMLVAMAMLTVILIGALILLDTTNRVTQTQMARADIQQSVRIGQEELVSSLRVAGRGGLLGQSAGLPLPEGIAINVENNVAASRTLFPMVGSSPKVMENSDILTIRGIFDSPLFYVPPLNQNGFAINPILQTGTLQIQPTTVNGGFPQDITYLNDLLTANATDDAVVLVSAYDDSIYGVAQVNWGASSLNANGSFTLAFNYNIGPFDASNPTGALEAISALSSGGAFPQELQTSGFKTAGILQEYRYFIRDTTVTGNASSRFAPKLSRTRTRVNQDIYWDTTEPFQDIADFVIDLQVALGFSNEGVNGGELFETSDGSDDSWYLNSDTDIGKVLPIGDLALIRVTTLARAGAPDRQYQAPVLLRLEDRSYTTDDVNDATERKFRRFFMPTVVDLRNL